MSPEFWPTPRARFCRRCGESLREVSVSVIGSYDPQSGKANPSMQRRWDCPRGTSDLTMGYESGHVSPDWELLG